MNDFKALLPILGYTHDACLCICVCVCVDCASFICLSSLFHLSSLSPSLSHADILSISLSSATAFFETQVSIARHKAGFSSKQVFRRMLRSCITLCMCSACACTCVGRGDSGSPRRSLLKNRRHRDWQQLNLVCKCKCVQGSIECLAKEHEQESLLISYPLPLILSSCISILLPSRFTLAIVGIAHVSALICTGLTRALV